MKERIRENIVRFHLNYLKTAAVFINTLSPQINYFSYFSATRKILLYRFTFYGF